MPEIHGAAGGLANVEGWAKIRGVWAKNGGVWAKIEKVGKECIFVGKDVISLGKEKLMISRSDALILWYLDRAMLIRARIRALGQP